MRTPTCCREKKPEFKSETNGLSLFKILMRKFRDFNLRYNTPPVGSAPKTNSGVSGPLRLMDSCVKDVTLRVVILAGLLTFSHLWEFCWLYLRNYSSPQNRPSSLCTLCSINAVFHVYASIPCWNIDVSPPPPTPRCNDNPDATKRSTFIPGHFLHPHDLLPY